MLAIILCLPGGQKDGSALQRLCKDVPIDGGSRSLGFLDSLSQREACCPIQEKVSKNDPQL